MSVKKLLISALAAVCAASLLSPAAYAHGCHGRSASVQRSGCAVCTVEDCGLDGHHTHGRTTYCGFDHEDGWCDGSCAPLCTVEGCALTGRHSHDGAVCCGFDHEEGWCDGSCIPLCTVEGCTLTGRHSHSGAVCCGSSHEEGFCDGSCPVSRPASTRGHHGGCHSRR